MTSGENYCLRLSDWGSNILASWQQLQIDIDFCDVTLVCEDGQIQSHRIIVSHSSPLLKNILKQSSSQNPVIYLRGVKYKHLENLIIFMYKGEVTVAEDDLGNLLDVAEDLEITGLSPENIECFIPSEQQNTRNIDDIVAYISNEEIHKDLDGNQMQQNSKESSAKKKYKIQNSTKVNTKYRGRKATSSSLHNEIDFFINDNLQNVEPEPNNEVSNLSNEKHNDQKLVPVIDRQFICNMCDKHYNRADSLRRHKAAIHEGVRYPCDQCNGSTFYDPSTLRKHNASAHEGVRYPCDQCNDSTFYDPSTLRRHKASAHEGVRYACNSCNYKATEKSKLRRHTNTIHNV